MAAANKIKILLLCLWFVGVSAKSEEKKTAESKNEFSMNGMLYKASMSAFIDFEKKLKNDYKKNNAIEKILADFRNYSINISENKDGVIVVFLLNENKSYAFFGVGGEYLIDKKDFHIIKKIFKE